MQKKQAKKVVTAKEFRELEKEVVAFQQLKKVRRRLREDLEQVEQDIRIKASTLTDQLRNFIPNSLYMQESIHVSPMALNIQSVSTYSDTLRVEYRSSKSDCDLGNTLHDILSWNIVQTFKDGEIISDYQPNYRQFQRLREVVAKADHIDD